ncbi:response regulator transcription factor [Sphingobacterium sp. SRCM116780]|uniref:response regulator n=1 Tax=Sphingobacterium sp. SRCM116780 TaxID=2907623 RepID=UPI001F170EA4|nr:response regulator transcription factor [Sphingobacterium sp. SRCM116780]UIR54631.1 response regulator transcription factor [Sphingobacterium sp. SRCM116780]
MTKILLVEDHLVVRNGIKMLLESQDDLEVIGEVSDGLEALEFLTNNENPNLIVTDMGMEGMDGMTLIKIMNEQHPSINILVLSMVDQLSSVKEAFQSGAKGYVLKNANFSEVLFAIRHITDNGFYMSEQISMNLLQQTSVESKECVDKELLLKQLDITDREYEVLIHIANGLTNIEIADQLFLSKRTVEGHRFKLIEKLKAKNSAELVKVSFQMGLLV